MFYELSVRSQTTGTQARIVGYECRNLALPKTREAHRYYLRNLNNQCALSINEQRHNDPTVGVQIGPVNLAQIPFAPAKTCENEKCGIVKRLIHEHTLPKKYVVMRIKTFMENKFLPYIQPLAPHQDYSTLKDLWDIDSSYSLKRKQQLGQLAEDYFNKYGTTYVDPEITKCKMFMKEEFYPDMKHPRMIISRSDTFKALVGPYIHQFDHELFHGHFADNFVKGKDSEWKKKRMQEIQDKYPLYMETDYSSFEGSQSLRMQLAIERTVLLHYFKHYPFIQELIKSCYDEESMEDKPRKNERMHRPPPTISSRFHDLGLVGNRKSGEMWTSSGNGLLNLINMMYLASLKNLEFDGIVEGDDGFFGLYEKKITSDDYSKLGYTIKLEYETNPNYLSFCGLRFTSDNTFVVDPENLNRIGWCEKRKYFKASKKTRLSLEKAKAMSLLCMAPACPILSVLCVSLISSIKVKENLNAIDPYIHDRLKYEKSPSVNAYPFISHQTRMDYAEMFGIPVETQLKLEESFANDPFSDFYLSTESGSWYMPSYEAGYRHEIADSHKLAM